MAISQNEKKNPLMIIEKTLCFMLKILDYSVIFHFQKTRLITYILSYIFKLINQGILSINYEMSTPE